MTKDYFANKSKSWDMNSKRVQNAKSIADNIIKDIDLNKNMKIMDFGVGTGLLSYFIAPHIKKIVAVDNSPSMLNVFKDKKDEFDCETEILELDLSIQNIELKLDGIVSSMTIHHLQDTKDLLTKFFNILNKDGFIALADLDKEDGTFHSDNIGVFHYGFNREELYKIAKDIGYRDITFKTVSKISKPHNEFTVFLMSAFK